MTRHGCAKTITTDSLRSYGAAIKELGISDRQEMGRYAINRAENSHQPFQRRERTMLRFKQMKTLQKSSSVHAAVHNRFNQKVEGGPVDVKRWDTVSKWSKVRAETTGNFATFQIAID